MAKEIRDEFRMMFADLEARLEEREDGEGSDLSLVGYASTFDERYEVWDFDEVVRRGAFKKSIESDDIRALWNHQSGVVLGRTKSGTLKLNEDSRGLRVRIDLPDTQSARELHTSVKRGDVDQMSFGFCTIEDRWTRPKDKKEPVLRELLEVQIFEVSPVTFPANAGTSIQARGDCPSEVRSTYEEHRWKEPTPPPEEDRSDLEILEAKMESLECRQR